MRGPRDKSALRLAVAGPVCPRCHVTPVRRKNYLCCTCTKLAAHERIQIELARATGERIEVDFSNAPIADRARLAVVRKRFLEWSQAKWIERKRKAFG